MTTAEQIAEIARTLPEALAREALEFIRALQARAADAAANADDNPATDFDDARR